MVMDPMFHPRPAVDSPRLARGRDGNQQILQRRPALRGQRQRFVQDLLTPTEGDGRGPEKRRKNVGKARLKWMV